MKRVLLVMGLIVLSGCAAGNFTIIPRGPGKVFHGAYKETVGQSDVEIKLPTGEKLKGTLIWIPPKSVSSAGIVMIGSKPLVGAGVASGNSGMYVGTLAGNRGTKMRIQLLCNTWTGKCVGVGVTGDGAEYDIQKQ